MSMTQSPIDVRWPAKLAAILAGLLLLGACGKQDATSSRDAPPADRFTCKVLENLMDSLDTGLANTAAGDASRRPASGIAVYASEAPSMAEKFSKEDPFSDEVRQALAALAEAASSNYSIAEAAPALLEHGRVVQKAMPQICPGVVVPDLTRHRN